MKAGSMMPATCCSAAVQLKSGLPGAGGAGSLGGSPASAAVHRCKRLKAAGWPGCWDRMGLLQGQVTQLVTRPDRPVWS